MTDTAMTDTAMIDTAMIDTATMLAAVIGAPVEHSLSPSLHNAAFAAAGVNALYVALRVEPEHLAAAVAGFRALGFLGVSVTVPHKEQIVAMCDRLAPPADRIGAVNCLAFEAPGERPGDKITIVGHNTDAGGFVDSLTRDAKIDPAGRKVVLLGAGGAARAVYAGLEDAGAEAVAVVARAPQQVAWTAAQPWTEDTLDQLCRHRCDLLVDCTPTALSPEREGEIPAPIPIAALPDHALVASLVYHREPALLAAARARGLATLDGAGMLVYQGARAFELWTGKRAPVSAMWAAMRDALG